VRDEGVTYYVLTNHFPGPRVMRAARKPTSSTTPHTALGAANFINLWQKLRRRVIDFLNRPQALPAAVLNSTSPFSLLLLVFMGVRSWKGSGGLFNLLFALQSRLFEM
jgi:hypothetical protein